jgi:cysteine sulfinate desulfinase/cysteine desulfurase-like protein
MGCSNAYRTRAEWVAQRVPNTTNLTLPFIEEGYGDRGSIERAPCSTGAACSSGAVEPSHWRLAPEDARDLRSVRQQTTDEEIDSALKRFPGH